MTILRKLDATGTETHSTTAENAAEAEAARQG